jgi:hypothetical protein
LSTKNSIHSNLKYIGELKTTELPVYKNSDFYLELKGRIEGYLKNKGIKNTKELSNFQVFNTFFVLFGLMFFYYMSSYSLNQNILNRVVYALLSGLFFHFSMVNFIDSKDRFTFGMICKFYFILTSFRSHMAFTKYPFVWQYFGNMCDIFCGISLCNWRHRHTIGLRFFFFIFRSSHLDECSW